MKPNVSFVLPNREQLHALLAKRKAAVTVDPVADQTHPVCKDDAGVACPDPVEYPVCVADGPGG
jgi:hypothetical protein